MKLSDFLPWGVLGAALIYLAWGMVQPSYPKNEMQLDQVAALPVVEDGRVKPLDSVARNDLMAISGKQTFKDEDGRTQPAIRWLLDVITPRVLKISPMDSPAADYKVFRIDNDQVLAILGLEPRKGFRYALSEFRSKYEAFDAEVKRAVAVPQDQRDLYDNKLLEVAGHIEMYLQLAGWSRPHAIPPPGGREGEWLTVDEAIAHAQFHRNMDAKATMAFLKVLVAYAKNDAEGFNQEVADYTKYLRENVSGETAKAKFEVFFNHFMPFEKAALLYAGVFLLICLSWFGMTGPLSKSAYWLAVAVMVVHTLSLCFRMYLTGRPPVTNLYSSAVFIGWGAALLCIGLEWIFKNGLCTLAASVLGGLTLIIAHNLAAGGDTMKVLVAVLDTNFWLATHVTCVTLGYTATFVAGILGLIYVIMGVLTPHLNQERGQTLSKMIYGTVCFATLLSFTGTVLGGIWADQSWGRFWGWDPKENGALIIVMWNALVLHARWGGIVKARGMAVLAIGGNIVTAWSWFGVNMLGVGLHSYGFMSGALQWLLAFVISQLVFMGIGCLPKGLWWSHNVKPPDIMLPPGPLPKISKNLGKRGGPGSTGIQPSPA